MKPLKAVIGLSSLIAVLALVAAAIGQFIGFTVPFAILTLIAIWFTVVLFRHVSESATPLAAREGRMWPI